MKKLKLLILPCLLCFAMILTACGGSTLSMPKNCNDVNSNGGVVVNVDNYIYYASVYTDYSSLVKGDNEEGKTEHNSICRIQTKNGVVLRDDDDKIKDVEVVLEKIAGYASSNMFTHGEYLYFTSPNTHLDKDGKTRFDLTTLFKIKLNGTDLQEIYTTEQANAMFYLVENNNPYLLMFDNSKILKLELDSKGNVETLAENVESTIFPKEYGKLDMLYYTVALSDEDKDAGLSGNYLYSLDLSSNTKALVQRDYAKKVTLVALENGTLYFKWLVSGEACYYCCTMENGFSNLVQITVIGEKDGTDSISNFCAINEKYATFVYDGKTYLSTNNKSSFASYEILVEEAVTVEIVSGSYIYYSTEHGIYRKDVAHKTDALTLAEDMTIMQGHLDFDEEYVYFYSQLKNNTTGTYYMHRAHIVTAENNGETKVECIAEVLSEDITTEEKTEA